MGLVQSEQLCSRTRATIATSFPPIESVRGGDHREGLGVGVVPKRVRIRGLRTTRFGPRGYWRLLTFSALFLSPPSIGKTIWQLLETRVESNRGRLLGTNNTGEHRCWVGAVGLGQQPGGPAKILEKVHLVSPPAKA